MVHSLFDKSTHSTTSSSGHHHHNPFPTTQLHRDGEVIDDENEDQLELHQRRESGGGGLHSACWFILVGITIIALSLGIFIPLQLNGFQRVTAPALEQKIGKLMAGSLKEIVAILSETIQT